MIKIKMILTGVLILLLGVSSTIEAQDLQDEIKGRWDLQIAKDDALLPSWLEVHKSGIKTLVGRFVYAFGSARPISEIKIDDGKFSFTIPPQWEGMSGSMTIEGMLDGDGLKGTMHYVDDKLYQWTAVRAPLLPYTEDPVWGEPIDLMNKKDLTGWQVKGESQWIVEDGILKNVKAGGNLISDQSFTDFKLHVEFRYPKGSNSGIYLRGRYEVQIEDNIGMEPSNTLFAGIYGFLTPNEMVAKSPGEWQEYDITLVGRRVTIVANGKPVIIAQNIPGITGGALDSNEGAPGPIFIQGDHGPIEFRSIKITPSIN